MCILRKRPDCLNCKHYIGYAKDKWFHCRAFPDGIPLDIFQQRIKHNKRFPGDNGIIYEAKS